MNKISPSLITRPQRLQSLKSDLRTQESILEMMKKSCTKEELAKLRKEWIEPIEKEIEGIQGKGKTNSL